MSTSSESNVVAAYTVYGIQVQVDDETWLQFGTDNADPEAILRIRDYREEHHADQPVRIVRTEVVSVVEDPEELRKQISESRTPAEGSAVQSE